MTMSHIYEVRQYNASRIIKKEQFNTAKDTYELLTRKELEDPHCVYENISKKDDYKDGEFDDKTEWMRKMNDEDFPLICVIIRINVKTRSKKILDYWFE
jgi:hypothetical protein